MPLLKYFVSVGAVLTVSVQLLAYLLAPGDAASTKPPTVVFTTRDVGSKAAPVAAQDEAMPVAATSLPAPPAQPVNATPAPEPSRAEPKSQSHPPDAAPKQKRNRQAKHPEKKGTRRAEQPDGQRPGVYVIRRGAFESYAYQPTGRGPAGYGGFFGR